MKKFVKIFFAKNRKTIFLLLSLIALMVGITNLYFLLEITPQKNDECIWTPRFTKEKNDIELIFTSVKKEGVTWNAGIRNGDKLLAINNNEARNAQVAQYYLNFVNAGDSALYKIEREGRVIETKVEIKKLILFGQLSFTLFSIIWMIVGIIVLMAKPEGRTQRIFYAIGFFSIFGCINVLLNANFGHNPVAYIQWLANTVDIINTIAMVFLPYIVIHFFLLFPKEKKIINRKYTLSVLYGLPFVTALVLILYSLGIVEAPILFAPTKLLVQNIFLILVVIACFIVLLVSYAELKTQAERKNLTFIVLAYAVGIAAIIYSSTIANLIAENIFNEPEYFMPIILVVLIPISFAYAIFKYSLLDVSDVLKNTIVYAIATIAIAAIYFLIIYFLGQTLSSFIGSDYQGILAGIIFIIFAILFQSTKDRLQELLTRRFYPEQFAYQKVIIKFSNDVTSIFGLDNILDSAHNTFIKELSIKRFGVIIKNFQSGLCELKRNLGLKNTSQQPVVDEISLYELLHEKTEKKLLPVFDIEECEKIFPLDYHALKEDGIYTIIPLVIKSRVTGLLLFGLKYSGAKFSGKDLELLVAATNQTALSIESARLYETESAKLKIEAELDNARKIQENLLPKSFPRITGMDIAGLMIPAMHIGGDYFDLIEIGDDKFFVIIGDVSGKGLSASLYMSKLQTMMRLYCTDEKSPKSILKEINKHVYASFERNWFITLSLALVDRKNNVMKYCRAGHTPLVVVNNGEIRNYLPSGIGLGLENGNLFESILEEIEIPLKPASLYFFYSDGVNEAMNERSEIFDVDRMESVLLKNCDDQSGVLLKILVGEINTFRNGREINDDLTCVLLKVTS